MPRLDVIAFGFALGVFRLRQVGLFSKIMKPPKGNKPSKPSTAGRILKDWNNNAFICIFEHMGPSGSGNYDAIGFYRGQIAHMHKDAITDLHMRFVTLAESASIEAEIQLNPERSNGGSTDSDEAARWFRMLAEASRGHNPTIPKLSGRAVKPEPAFRFARA